MKAGLSTLLDSISAVPASAEREVTGLALDSRQVRARDLFLALPGTAVDGRKYIQEAVAAGAAAIVYEAGDGYTVRDASVPAVGVTDLRRRLGTIADRFYDAPSRKLIVVGVTGTNGKTTCTQILAQALDRPPRRCAVIGTLGCGFPDALNKSTLTTPDVISVHRLLRELLDAGATSVSMEVSSHALDQGRVNDVAFELAVFTNHTRDHLDYHGNMQAYGAAKARLFESNTLKHAVINRDDAFGKALLDKLKGGVATLSYGFEGSEINARRLTPTPRGLTLDVVTPWGEAQLDSALFGRFNAYNLLAVLATLLLLEVSLTDAVQRLSQAQPVAGRAERFGGKQGQPLVIVDYAHTPDALEKILTSRRGHADGKLICVFGGGGDRDRGKRPLMGAIAERFADAVIITDDNPRTELPDQIIDDIRAGMSADRATLRVIRDRRQAIAAAINSASADDIVLVAGKGHEDYQQVGQTRLPYSDRVAVRAILGEVA